MTTPTQTPAELYNKATQMWNENPADKDSVIALFEQAIDAGSVSAIVDLGYIYEVGENGIPVDYTKAIKYYKMAAELGNSTALSNLAGLYLSGNGVKKDKALAAHYAALGAAEGGSYSKRRYGTILLNGDGVQKNIKKAMPLLVSSAEQGDEISQEKVDYVNNNFTLKDDYSPKKSVFKLGIGICIICPLMILLSFFIMKVGFSEYPLMDGLNKLIIVASTLSFVNIISAILMIAKNKAAFNILRVNAVLGLLFVLPFFGYIYSNGTLYDNDPMMVLIFSSTAFIVSSILTATMFIRNYDKLSFASVFLEDNPTINALYELGNTKDYYLSSQKSKRFLMRANISFYVLGAIVLLFSLYMVVFLSYDITISDNAFDSPLTLFLFFVAIPFSLFSDGFSMTTFIKETDAHGTSTVRKSDDLTDTAMDGLWPIIIRFVIQPAGIAILAYYIIYLLLSVLSLAMPLIFATIAILMLLKAKKSLKNIVYKKYRQKLFKMAITMYSLIYLLAFVILFFWGGGHIAEAGKSTTKEITQISASYTIPGTESGSVQTATSLCYPTVNDGSIEDFDQFLEVFFSADIERQKERVIYSDSTIVLARTEVGTEEVSVSATADTWRLLAKIDKSKCVEYTINRSDNDVWLNFGYGRDKFAGQLVFVLIDNKWHLKRYIVYDTSRKQ